MAGRARRPRHARDDRTPIGIADGRRRRATMSRISLDGDVDALRSIPRSDLHDHAYAAMISVWPAVRWTLGAAAG
jgi:hypothetical protein